MSRKDFLGQTSLGNLKRSVLQVSTLLVGRVVRPQLGPAYLLQIADQSKSCSREDMYSPARRIWARLNRWKCIHRKTNSQIRCALKRAAHSEPLRYDGDRR